MRILYWPPFLVLLGLAGALTVFRATPRAHRPPLTIHGLRWLLGTIFAISGLAKLIPGFPNTIGPPNLEAILSAHGLGLFGRFVALSEVAVGTLLMTRRFATLGAVMVLPITLGLLVTTISLGWRGTPVVNGILLILTLALLVYDYPKLAPLVGARPATANWREAATTHSSSVAWVTLLGILLLWLAATRITMADGVWVALCGGGLLALIVYDWRMIHGAA